MQKQLFVTTNIACDLSVLVCVWIIDDMIGSTFCVFDESAVNLIPGFGHRSPNIVFKGAYTQGKEAFV